jgi:hypothetical protein
MMGRPPQQTVAERAVDELLLDPLEQIFEASRKRVSAIFKQSDRRLAEARRAVLQETVDTPIKDTIQGTRRSHARGHDLGPEWREENR